MVCYTFDHRSGRKPDTGGQQPAAYPRKQYFFETDATKGLPLAWNAGQSPFYFAAEKGGTLMKTKNIPSVRQLVLAACF